MLQEDIPAIVSLIVHCARWVSPETFRQLPVWAPHTARGKPLYDAGWVRRYTNKNRSTGIETEKFEGNVAALKALVAALGVANPKPRNWTVCHIWGYDDPRFAERSSIVQDPKYFSCVANMVWLPTPLKGFTDTVPSIKNMLRVCAYYQYGWACEHESVEEQRALVESGWLPDGYPQEWPGPKNPHLLAPGTMPLTEKVAVEITRRKNKIVSDYGNMDLVHYPRDEVRDVLEFWKVDIDLPDLHGTHL